MEDEIKSKHFMKCDQNECMNFTRIEYCIDKCLWNGFYSYWWRVFMWSITRNNGQQNLCIVAFYLKRVNTLCLTLTHSFVRL